MKIIGVRLGHLSTPLKAPFKTALRTVTHVESVLVRIETDTGHVGYGSASPSPPITGETTDSIRQAIEGSIARQIIGCSIEDFEVLMSRVHNALDRNTSAKAAVDIALYDLYGQWRKVPVYQLLGGHRRELVTDLTISVNEPEEMLRDSLEAVTQGFTCLKVKVGKDPAKDMEALRLIRDGIGDAIALRIDANQAWTPQEAVRILKKIEDTGIRIELVEQPVPGHDLEGLRQVKENVSIPVVADEGAFSLQDVQRIIRMRAADMVNIKLMKTGGIHEALAICAIAENAGMECMIGCMMESRISVTAAAHLACAKQIITKIDLDAPILCAEDRIEGGALFRDDTITLSDAPGFGFTFDSDSLS